MTEDRFYVLEHAGWRRPDRTRAPESLEVMILDRYYCHRVVWSQTSGYTIDGLAGHGKRERIRARAARLCAQLNETERFEVAA